MRLNLLRWCWKGLPDGLQRRIRTFPPLAAGRRTANRRRWEGRAFNEIYDAEYFEFVEKTTGTAAPILADSIFAVCRPRYALDVGCGTGAVLAALRDRGVKVVGLEPAEAGRAACRRRGIEVHPFDASSDVPPSFEGVDLVISLEVGHAIPEVKSDHYVEALCFYRAEAIVFSSDRPGGGDRLALNEKPRTWWIDQFGRRGYFIDEGVTRQWQSVWKEQRIAHWLYENVMFLRRREIG